MDFWQQLTWIVLGEDFYIPFLQEDKNDEIYQYYMQRTRDRKAGLYVDDNQVRKPKASS